MATREEVEALLATVEQIHKPNHGVIAETCRAWLAVDDAPSGTTQTFSYGDTTDDDGGCYGIAMFRTTYIPAGTYKLVCIETPTGVREG